MNYLAASFFVAMALIVAFYSWIGALICLAIAYFCFKATGVNSVPSESYAEFTIFDDDEGDMEVVRENEHELVVRGNNRVLIIDKRKRTISGIDKLLALFNDVQAVQIRRHAQRHGWPDTYTVEIVTGRCGTLNLGRTIDEVDASIMAAKLGTWLGATVRS